MTLPQRRRRSLCTGRLSFLSLFGGLGILCGFRFRYYNIKVDLHFVIFDFLEGRGSPSSATLPSLEISSTTLFCPEFTDFEGASSFAFGPGTI
jgi:hypothetical protein